MSEAPPLAPPPDANQSRARRGPPLQLVIMMAFVGALMLVIWFKLSSPVFSEGQKARDTALFFLEAIGQAPVEKTGQELHPDVRRQFTPETLSARFAELGLNDRALAVTAWHDERESKEPPEWRWRIQVQTGQGSFPLLVSVRIPEQMSISRRWRTYTLCRLDLDLRAQALKQLAEAPSLEAVRASGFEPQLNVPWPILGYEPLRLSVPGRQGHLELDWQVVPGEQLNCLYTLQAHRQS